jgi:hypothetical protein
MRNNFIGYGTLEALTSAASMLKTLYVNSVTQPGKTSARGLRTDRLVVIVSQIDGEGNVHYCRIPTGTISYVAGTPFEDTKSERRERHQVMYEMVKEWLTTHGFAIREAVVAMPSNLTYLDGWPDFVRYDEATKTFVRKTTTNEGRNE